MHRRTVLMIWPLVAVMMSLGYLSVFGCLATAGQGRTASPSLLDAGQTAATGDNSPVNQGVAATQSVAAGSSGAQGQGHAAAAGDNSPIRISDGAAWVFWLALASIGSVVVLSLLVFYEVGLRRGKTVERLAPRK